MGKKYLSFIILIIQINSLIINNPINLGIYSSPFLLSYSNNNYNYIITSGKIIKMNGEDGTFQELGGISNIITYSSNDKFIVDRNNNNYIYLLVNNKYYEITYETNFNFGELTPILETKYRGYGNQMTIIGTIPLDEGFIIFGRDSNHLIFSHKSEQYRSPVELNNLSDNISCKYINNSVYMCNNK